MQATHALGTAVQFPMTRLALTIDWAGHADTQSVTYACRPGERPQSCSCVEVAQMGCRDSTSVMTVLPKPATFPAITASAAVSTTFPRIVKPLPRRELVNNGPVNTRQ